MVRFKREDDMNFEDLFSRREFLKDLGLAGTFVLLAYTGGCEQLIEIIENRPTRRNIANMMPDDPIVMAYKAAVIAMKGLDSSAPADMRGWKNQALIHNNHCPHGNWFFLPWHRAYLLYFERICRKFSGNANFALPYWNWTVRPTVPSVFWDGSSGSCAAPCPPTSLPSPTNPLFDCSRAIGPSDAVADAFVGSTVMESILNEPNFFLFASNQAVGQRDFAGYGLLEETPHNHVHGRIGGYMGAYCSPIDPVFWTHHCMIDFCWVEWNINRGNPNTNNSSWLNFPLIDFVDENNTPVNIPIVDTLLFPILSYQYEHSQMGTHASLAPFPAQPPKDNARVRAESLRGVVPAGSLAFANANSTAAPGAEAQETSSAARQMSKSDAKALEKFLRKGAPVKLEFTNRYNLARSMTIQVGRPAAASIPIEPGKVGPALDVQSRNRLYLTLGGVTMPKKSDQFVRVFLNKPDASAETPLTDPHYAGSFAFFVDEHAMHGNASGTPNAGFVVDATEVLRRLNQAAGLPDHVDVQLVAVAYEHRSAEGQQFTLENLELGIAPVPNVQKFHLSR
jgi:tyrosinase